MTDKALKTRQLVEAIKRLVLMQPPWRKKGNICTHKRWIIECRPTDSIHSASGATSAYRVRSWYHCAVTIFAPPDRFCTIHQMETYFFPWKINKSSANGAAMNVYRYNALESDFGNFYYRIHLVEGEKFDRHNLIMAMCVRKGGRS